MFKSEVEKMRKKQEKPEQRGSSKFMPSPDDINILHREASRVRDVWNEGRDVKCIQKLSSKS
jgi:hypothetical protein